MGAPRNRHFLDGTLLVEGCAQLGQVVRLLQDSASCALPCAPCR